MSPRIRRTARMSKSLFYAIVVHLIVGVLLMLNIDWPAQAVSPPAAQPAPVQANVVSEAEIQKQMEAVQQKEEARKQKQLEAEKKLEEILNRKKEEEERLAKIQERQEAEEREAEQLAKQKEQEQQELAKLERERELKREREEEQRREQAEAERRRKEEAERQRKAEEEQRQKELAAARQREEELQQELERERVQRRVDSALAQYIPIIKQKVSRNWNRPASLQTNSEAHVNVRLSQAGEVISARIVKSSGNPVFDRSVENAVLKASPLPIPQERGVNEEFRNLRLRFKPDEMMS